MRILITGGAGFIASHIADAYLKAGHEVVILDDLSTGRRENIPPEARFLHDGLLSPRLGEIIAEIKPDLINHHAAQIDVRRSVADPVGDAQTNILGTLNLLEKSRRCGVQKIIFASSGGAIYGEQLTHPADESHPEIPRNPYGITKLTTEKYLQFYRIEYGMPFVALRYANIYGPRQNALGEAGVVAIFASKLLKGETPTIFGDGRQTRDFVFVGDVVDCNLEALKPDVTGIFNVGTGIETDVSVLAAEIGRLTGISATPHHAPPRPGEQERSSLNPGALQRHPPTRLADGLQKTVEWFRGRPQEAPS